MQESLEFLKKNALFQGIAEEDYHTIIKCLNGTIKNYDKGDTILFYGDLIKTIGIIIHGKICVSKEDAEGHQNLLTELQQNEMFAEVFVCAGIASSPVHVIASEATKILYLSYENMMHPNTYMCSFHKPLITNMMKILAQKNLMLNQKIEILSKRTTRERILLYFDYIRGNSHNFTIPLKREELAAYLCVDRSAMSTELSRMMKDGIIEINHNHVLLRDKQS